MILNKSTDNNTCFRVVLDFELAELSEVLNSVEILKKITGGCVHDCCARSKWVVTFLQLL